MSENKQKNLFDYLLLIIFGIYWLFFILEIIIDKSFKDNGKIIYIIEQLLIFIPLTITIAFQKDVFAIFICILYEISMILMGFYTSLMNIINLNINNLLPIISSVITFSLSIFLIINLINMIRNKIIKYKGIMIILSFLSIIISAISYFLYNLDFSNIMKFLMQLDLICLISIYIIFFPKKELHIFND